MELSGRKQGLLPVEAYTSKEWFEKEQQCVFGSTWQFGGFEEDVAQPGDYVTVQAGPHPLLVVRGPDMQLRGFHNICRHRGTQLLRTIGKSKKSLICPYHHWTYSLEGELKNIPGEKTEFPNIEKGQLCLRRASVDIWKGMIFVHPDPKASCLKEWFYGVEDSIGPHRPEELIEYEKASTKHEINANWKLVVENYIDGYHLSHLHSESLNMYDHSKQQSGFTGPHFLFFEPLTKSYLDSLEKQSLFPIIDHGPRSSIGAYVPMLFPNLGIGATENTWSTFDIVPVAEDKTIVETRTKVMPASNWEYAKQGFSAWWNWKGKRNKKFDGGPDDPLSSGDFMAEDIFACEQQFKAMHSPMFAVGATAKNLEKAILEFQQHVLNQLNRLV